MGAAHITGSTDCPVVLSGRRQEVMLPDGTAVPVRPIGPDDDAPLQRFHSRLSQQTIYRRFFSWVPQLSDLSAAHFTHLDTRDRVAFVGLDPGAPTEIIAVVRFDRKPGTDRAEYAAVVADSWQHHGLGLALTRVLIDAARAHGIASFDAYVLPENRPMLALFGRLGLPMQTHRDGNQVLRVAIELTGVAPAAEVTGPCQVRVSTGARN